MPDSPDIGRDAPRQVATDRDFTLALEEVAERYVASGHPRTIRTLQRYCANGHLDCQKVQTALGDKYLVAPYSVARHIAQINEVIAFTDQATSRDQPRPAATGRDTRRAPTRPRHPRHAPGDTRRHVATCRDRPRRQPG
ncbi:MAG: hypothetical protein AB7E80_17075 [Hyphomicrobiaceae bacterium]